MITKYKLRSCFVRLVDLVAIKPTLPIEAAEARLSHNALPLQPFQQRLSDDLDVTINSSTSDKSMQSLRSMDISEESQTSETSRMEISLSRLSGLSESSPSFNHPNRPNEPVPSFPWVQRVQPVQRLPLLRDDPFDPFHPFLTIGRLLSIALDTIHRFVISTLSNKSQ